MRREKLYTSHNACGLSYSANESMFSKWFVHSASVGMASWPVDPKIPKIRNFLGSP